uniref:Uncharacterized protein n=1 Tax=Ananas comosus var. bracteatus TaxID=296719 RepID=A0A6V7PSP7_ANACO|nr:unnamed protein product [Ananas comosus var. bracteatus]
MGGGYAQPDRGHGHIGGDRAVVSLGPFHHGEPRLRPMEEHKQRALVHFIKRTQVPFDDLVAAAYDVVQQLQDAYQKLDGEFRDNKGRFVELMIVDGCFMLEKLVAVETRGQPPNEDQIINRWVLEFLSSEAQPLAAGVGLGLHPLDVFRKSMLLQSPPRRSRPQIDSDPFVSEIIRPAVELYEAGLRFKKSETLQSLRDIQFSHGVLSLPVITVDDTTEYMFLNLMAFESLHIDCRH